MEQTYLPGKIRDRIQDLMKSRKVTQAELATRIGCSESSLSRFISGKTDKLGDENIIRIARVFNVSTDFLLGEVDTPDRLNYDIAELGLSVQAARNLYTGKANAEIVNHSTAAVQVSSVTLTAENGWTLVPYASDMSHAKVDSNQIGFKINSAQTSKTGSTEQFELTSPWQINEEESLTLSYDAVVSALSQPVTNANILSVLFVVEWA